jgi:Calcineurin-like phosphoesterase
VREEFGLWTKGREADDASLDELLDRLEWREVAEMSGGAPTTLHMRLIRARILWPALGFPAVIAPRAGASRDPLDGDATRSIRVLLLSDKKDLTREDAARLLRYTQWSQRRRRNIKPGASGSFAPADLMVRNNLAQIGPPDNAKLADVFQFGGDRKGQNAVCVSLAQYVRRFYQQQGLAYLHEICISEAASAGLADGQYQLFWNKDGADENQPSDEIGLLLERFAAPRRSSLGEAWRKWLPYLIDEYKFEYGALHLPYYETDKTRQFTEVLHPLFVRRNANTTLAIGHMTDTHVNVRADVYEHNLRTAGQPFGYSANRLTYKSKPLAYNNWNRDFILIYSFARQNSDVVLLTGDLIDYGRGHLGTVEASHSLGVDSYYHVDRNWFLFYYLLAAGESYTKPVYTILGNHDWRLNPYPPFAPGAPEPKLFIHNHLQFIQRDCHDEDLTRILRAAHGPGYEKAYAYSMDAQNALDVLLKYPQKIPRALTYKLDFGGSPLETSVESVAWYLMLINPFLDYRFAMATGHQFLMLDWGRGEELANFDEPRTFMGFGQRAANILSAVQKWQVSEFTRAPGRAKVIGLHAPPIGPYPNWFDEDLFAGSKTYKPGEDARVRYPDGSIKSLTNHTLLAIRRKPDPFGVAADYGSFVRERDWFITTVASPQSGIRAVLTGHNHRANLLVAYKLADGMAIRGVAEAATKGVRPPGVAVRPLASSRITAYPPPLYVNTTSAGPRGDEYVYSQRARYCKNAPPNRHPGYAIVALSNDGTIQAVSMRQMIPERRGPW